MCAVACAGIVSSCGGGGTADDAGASGLDAAAIDAAIDVGPIEVTIESIEMTRWVDEGTPLASASVTVRYATPFPVDRVVNIAVDVNGDGLIAAYALPSGQMQEEWIAQDDTWAITSGPLTRWFALRDPAASSSELRVYTSVSTDVIGAPPMLGGAPGGSLERMVMLTAIESPTVTTVTGDAFGGPAAVPKQPPQEHFDSFGDDVVVGSTRTPEGLRRTGLPDPIQDSNGCLLSSLAANLSWLARANGFAECLPGLDNPDMSIFESEIDRVGMLAWSERDGVQRLTAQAGIPRFLSETGIPVTLTVLDRLGDTPPTSAQIGMALGEALTNGCAVVIGVQFPEGAHALTLAGMNRTGRRVSGLVVHNSQTETYDDVHPIARNEDTDEMMLLAVPRADLMGRDLGPGDVPITQLYVMCVGGVPSVNLAFAHNAIPAGADVHARCFDEGHMSAPDMCACDHWHSGPRGTSIRGQARVMEMAENPCGHGCYTASTPWAALEERCCGIPPPP